MKLMTYKKAAEFLDMPLGTLYALVHQQRIPHIRMGSRLVRFDLVELERWLADKRQTPDGEQP